MSYLKIYEYIYYLLFIISMNRFVMFPHKLIDFGLNNRLESSYKRCMVFVSWGLFAGKLFSYIY